MSDESGDVNEPFEIEFPDPPTPEEEEADRQRELARRAARAETERLRAAEAATLARRVAQFPSFFRCRGCGYLYPLHWISNLLAEMIPGGQRCDPGGLF